MSTYILVHGAWHTGAELEDTAAPIREAGHEVFCPTLAGNRPGDNKQTGLDDAITSLSTFIEEQALSDFVLVGHSYGGMLISAIGDRMPERVRRLVYWNAFVPNHGESLNDLVPPHYVALFDELTLDDGSVTLPYPLWRDVFINDADEALAQSSYAVLNPHPTKTFRDAISLQANPADMKIGKSYLNATEDIAMPHSYGWHPRLSEKLGMFRLVQCRGSHEICFTNPQLLAEKIIEAGRD